MICAWQELLGVLPPWLRPEVDKFGKTEAQEIRLRLGHVTEIVAWPESIWLKGLIRKEDLTFCMNAASRYSPWSAQTSGQGYLTAPGGHRIGICGEAVMKDGRMDTVRRITSLCIRVARDFPDIGEEASFLPGSILIIGPPGCGKTTLLRDLVRCLSTRQFVSVVDERGELFPELFIRGTRLDVLQGCPKQTGIEIVLRTMGPDCIAVDEITEQADCDALLRAGWCGVRLIATAHAGSLRELMMRPLYQPLLRSGIFDHILVMSRDKSWKEECLPC